ncbi:MAG: DUF2959 domain-containing protein [Bryobacteraceae bacterium]|nr:DUF2959 domain-containing protein [Bryobacteraceae bacterium]
MRQPLLAMLALAGLALTSGCGSLYYAAQEKIGNEKRDILVKRVEAGRKDQEEAKKQIKTTLEAFQEVTGFQGGDLERVYKKLDGEYQDSESRASDLKKQIASIEQVAGDMFKEWSREIELLKNPQYKAESRRMLRDTQQRYGVLIAKMKQSERKMAPVLAVFRDQVLFLKHNLNARAIRSLKETAFQMDTQVEALVQDIDASIKEADDFIVQMKKDAAS